MSVEFTLTEEELSSANIGDLTTGLTALQKVEWSYIYTHKAANLQGKLVAAYVLDNFPYAGENIPIPQSAKDAWKATINALATRILLCQDFVEGVTD